MQIATCTLSGFPGSGVTFQTEGKLMKKILFATAALVAGGISAPQIASAQSVSAGNAEITLGGYARFGVGYNEDRAEESIIISRFRLNINAAVELDSGVRLAATVRGQSDENSDGTAGALTFGGARFQVSSGGLRVRVGNISGVFDDSGTIRPFADVGLEGQVGMVSSFGFPGPAFGNGSANNGVLVNYNFGDLKLAASYVADNQNTNGDEDVQFGVGYSFGDYNIGALVGRTETAAGADNDYYLLSLDGSIGAFGFAAVVGENDNTSSDTAYGFSVNYDIGAATNIQLVYNGGGVADLPGNDDGVAVGFTHQLGAGARVQGFIGQNNSGSTIADLGVRFNF
ncbi:MAG: porin [Sulfitobacter sp.]